MHASSALALSLGSVGLALLPSTAAGRPAEVADLLESQRCCRFFAGAAGDLDLDPATEGAANLRAVASRYAEVTNQNLVFSAPVEAMLASTPTGLQGAVHVPAADVQSFFEQLLVAHDFVLHTLRASEPRVLQIESLETQARPVLRQRALVVGVDEVEHFADHPATLITTAVHFEHADARQISTSLRALVTDAWTQQLSPAGKTNTLVVTGFGSGVADLVALMARIDVAEETPEPALAFEVVSLQYAEARPMAHTLRSLLGVRPTTDGQAAEPTAGFPRFMPDDRTNSIVIGASREQLSLIKRLVRSLDAEQ